MAPFGNELQIADCNRVSLWGESNVISAEGRKGRECEKSKDSRDPRD